MREWKNEHNKESQKILSIHRANIANKRQYY